MRLPPQRSHSEMPVKRWPLILNNERGVLLSIVLSLILVLVIEFAALAQFSSSAMRQVRAQENYTKTFYAAEAVSEKALASIHWTIENTGAASFTNFTPHLGSNFNGTMSFTVGGNTSQKLAAGSYKGLTANVQTVTIAATAADATGFTPVTVNISQDVQIEAIPVFQFGVFYQNDLEVCPGSNMTFQGRVHANGDMYLASDGASLTFSADALNNSKLTAAGSIDHGRKSGATGGTDGSVYMSDTSNTPQSMKNPDGTWLDSNHLDSSGNKDWATAAETRWGGNVEDSSQNIKTLTFPLPIDSNDLQHPEVITDRVSSSDPAVIKNAKFESKAQVVIKDNAVTNNLGVPLELRYCSKTGKTNTVYNGSSCPSGYTLNYPVSTPSIPASIPAGYTGSFYSPRESNTSSATPVMIKTTDIDVAKLQESPNFQSIAASAPAGVIIYVSDHTYDGTTSVVSGTTYSNQAAVRLINGSTLPANGMTLATDNPLFVKGDYNTVSKKKAGLVSDSLNILSNSWLDTNDANKTSALSSRTASSTTVNSAIITGVTETAVGPGYNGGLENTFRLTENWSGKTLTYAGAIAVLYNSRRGVGDWNSSNHLGSAYYGVPTRVWSYDTSLANTSVPGFPSVYYVFKSKYEQT